MENHKWLIAMLLPLFIAGILFVAGCPEEDPQFEQPPTEEPVEPDPFEMPPEDDFDQAPQDDEFPGFDDEF